MTPGAAGASAAPPGTRARTAGDGGASSPPGGLAGWLYERFGIATLTYPVPAHANGVLYTLGGISLVGFAVLVVSGVYLAQFYHPDPATAHTSVVYVMTMAPLGEFVRGVHYWTAYVVSITVGLHLLRVFFSGAYKAPREMNWLVGLALLAVTMGFVFTGTVLKWDQEGVEALVHNEDVATLLGGAGAWFSPEFSVGVPLLLRVYFAHVAILPALLTVFVVGHVFLIKALGMAPLGRADGRESDPRIDPADLAALYGEPIHPFTSHIRRIVGWGAAVTSIAMALAVALPAPLGPQGVPGIEVTKPPFTFWWLYAAEDALGIRGLLAVPAIFFAVLALLPFVDRGRYRALRRRKPVLVAGVLLLALLVGLTIYTGVTRPVAHTQM